MERRTVVKGIILFSLGTGIIYSCTDKYKAIKDLGLDYFDPIENELDLLAILSEIITPIRSIPELVNHTPLPFIFTMLDDIYKPESREVFLEGYQNFDEYIEKSEGKKFTQMEAKEQHTIVEKLNNHGEGIDERIQSFFDLVKTESINYLRNSEYYQRKVNYYEMAPGRYKGEVLISALKNANDV